MIKWILSFQLISFLLGLSTKAGIYPWYQSLDKSSLTPPSYIFGLMWPLLYISLAIFGYVIHKKNVIVRYRQIIKLYWLQLLLNWVWSPVFFNLHAINFAFGIIMLILVINIIIVNQLSKIQKYNLIFLLIPYLIWIGFAGYLNFYIIYYN